MDATTNLEANALAEFLRLLRIDVGPKQVARSETRVGLLGMGADEAYLREKYPSLRDDTLADFLSKNARAHPAAPLLLGENLIYLTDDDFLEMFRDNRGWDRFQESYPETRGILEFSRIGFSSDLDQALCYVGVTYDGMAGSGFYSLFASENANWINQGSLPAWIS